MSRSQKNDSTPSPGHANGSSTRSAGSTVADAAVGGPVVRTGLLLALATCVVAIDQLTKWWAVEALADDPVDLFWTLRLRVVRNFGGSFGVGAGQGTLISILGLVVVGGLLVAVWKPRPRGTVVAFGFFVGGALGNIVDRLVRAGDGLFGGGVIDFIDLQWWPVFNVADIALFVGVGVLLFFGDRDPTSRNPVDEGFGTDA